MSTEVVSRGMLGSLMLNWKRMHQQAFQSGIFFHNIVPSEQKRYNPGAACDVEKLRSTYMSM